MDFRSLTINTLLFAALAALHLASASAASSFEGVFTRAGTSQSGCTIDPSSCDYLCTVAYNITVSGASLTMVPLGKPPGCVCYTLTATVNGNVAAGVGPDFSFSLALTPTGVSATSTVRGKTCTGSFVLSNPTSSSLSPSTVAPITPTPSTQVQATLAPSNQASNNSTPRNQTAGTQAPSNQATSTQAPSTLASPSPTSKTSAATLCSSLTAVTTSVIVVAVAFALCT